MQKSIYVSCVAALSCTLSLLAAGCSSDASQPTHGSGGVASSGTAGRGGSNPSGAGGSGPVTGGTGGVLLGGGGSLVGIGSSGGTPASAGGSSPGTGGSNVSTAGAGGADSGTTGGSTAMGAGGSTTGSGGARTVELIGPGPATCGATNATHGDGFVCVLNYPSDGPNVVGYWFDYAFVASTCNLSMTKPTGNKDANPKVCFSGSACPATSGGGLGVALCDVHDIDVSTWPQLAALETASSLSATLKSPFNGCNPGAMLSGVSWTLGSGTIPTGMSVLFDDAADKTVARVDIPAGATSVDMPPNVDTSKVASLKFSTSGASSPSWNFCLTSVKVSLH